MISSPRSTAAHASVTFLRIHGFAQMPVAEQARLKTRLEQVVGASLGGLQERERIVLDAPEGIAVVVLANPRAALRLAWDAGTDRDMALAAGVSHGPVRVTEGPSPVIHGDALASAEAIARATGPGSVSASRDFRDALRHRAPGLARLLARSGSAVDAAGRAHELFAADPASCAKGQRRFLAVGGVAAVLVVGLGIALRSAAPPAIVPDRPATINLDIKPEGEIWVDGALKGRSPPLRKIQLTAGRHTLEIRSGKHKPLVTELLVAEGEELSVQHSFTAPAAQQAPKPFWRRWMDKLK